MTPVKLICMDCLNEGKTNPVVGCITQTQQLCEYCGRKQCEAKNSTLSSLLFCSTHYAKRFVVLKGSQQKYTFEEGECKPTY